MRRITQLLASILFIITVLTIYLAFDFAINNIVAHKHDHHGHEHKKFRSTSSVLFVTKINRINSTLTYNSERRTRSVKQKHKQGKPAQFHKSKTGIKINQIKKSIKEQRKHLLTTKTIQQKDLEIKYDKHHV